MLSVFDIAELSLKELSNLKVLRGSNENEQRLDFILSLLERGLLEDSPLSDPNEIIAEGFKEALLIIDYSRPYPVLHAYHYLMSKYVYILSKKHSSIAYGYKSNFKLDQSYRDYVDKLGITDLEDVLLNLGEFSSYHKFYTNRIHDTHILPIAYICKRYVALLHQQALDTLTSGTNPNEFFKLISTSFIPYGTYKGNAHFKMLCDNLLYLEAYKTEDDTGEYILGQRNLLSIVFSSNFLGRLYEDKERGMHRYLSMENWNVDRQQTIHTKKFRVESDAEYIAQMLKGIIYSILGYNQFVSNTRDNLHQLLYAILDVYRDVDCDQILRETIKILEYDDLGPLLIAVQKVCPNSTVLTEIQQKLELLRGLRYHQEI